MLQAAAPSATKSLYIPLKHQHGSLNSSVVSLCVGGALYRTSRDVLLRLQGSVLHAMALQSSHVVHVLDVKPAYFLRLMAYARTGILSFDTLSELECLQMEATLLTLRVTVPAIDSWTWAPSRCAVGLGLSFANRRVTQDMPSVDDSFQSVMGSASINGFQLRVESDLISSVFVGYAPMTNFHPRHFDPRSNGYCMNIGASDTMVPLHQGDILAVRYDKSHVRFQVNEEQYSMQVNPFEDALFPVVCCRGRASLSIVHFKPR
ncbi:Aste57867_3010 [Aphanomyces stellatus]|uniref:Aste57867_3010 protein n=1 Tax=Aphanomyces stellatus TaxID=120398 RepID=A0A485K9H2_9STRA|nr:hypothetical protein As57867_003001 [Aphanomyces stellatus]VFT80190.1 Aste57867_3010 [Aphanomyces stellatus]